MNEKIQNHPNGIIIGLTGNIASGKSTVGNILQQLGAKVIDADQVARQVVQAGTPTLEKLVNSFGEKILNTDGTLNRNILGDIVFSNKESLETLNSITHPPIRSILRDIIDEFRSQSEPGIMVLEAALLYETGLNQMVDQVWFINAPFSDRIERLMMRNGMTYEEAMKRIKSQNSEEMKLHKSDVIINNDGDLDALKRYVSEVFHKTLQN